MKTLYKIAAAVLAFMSVTSCDEFTPVFTGKYPEPGEYEKVEMTPTHTIAELVAMYKLGKPQVIKDDIVIAGKVSTSDRTGNFYRSFYIQDETGGIEIKIGKTGLYNDYKPGQTVYVKCEGLTLGMYGYKSGNYGGSGMVQLGYEDPTGDYETSYLDVAPIIDRHIFRGEFGEPVVPQVVTESQLPGKNDTQATNRYVGSLVTLKGLRYAEEVFALLYLDSNKDTKLSSNRVFLSRDDEDEDTWTWGITTWAMSKNKYLEYLSSGVWDKAKVGNGNDQNYGTVGTNKEQMMKNASAYSVSQYLTMGNKEIQIRTSGYSRFADTEIDPEVLNGNKTIDVTGVITLYQGSIQFTLIDIADVKVN